MNFFFFKREYHKYKKLFLIKYSRFDFKLELYNFLLETSFFLHT